MQWPNPQELPPSEGLFCRTIVESCWNGQYINAIHQRSRRRLMKASSATESNQFAVCDLSISSAHKDCLLADTIYDVSNASYTDKQRSLARKRSQVCRY